MKGRERSGEKEREGARDRDWEDRERRIVRVREGEKKRGGYVNYVT